jgi:hypothetical protein
MWADQVECLLDMHEAHLDAQATSFLKALERDRRGGAAGRGRSLDAGRTERKIRTS